MSAPFHPLRFDVPNTRFALTFSSSKNTEGQDTFLRGCSALKVAVYSYCGVALGMLFFFLIKPSSVDILQVC